jgi:glyoxylase-like metal-dependent hydrolase (beta-lactamase superfamily II)
MREPVEVTPLCLARVELPSFHPAAPGTDTIYGFLVRDGDDCILVDTGVGAGNALIERLYKPDRVELAAALGRAGASLGDVTAVVNSHLHFDHCGNNSLFPSVPIFVQRAELEAARVPHYTVPGWVDFPGASYVPVDGSRALSERLELLPTPGHTPGHQSLVIRTGRRVEIIARPERAFFSHDTAAWER